VAAVGLAGIAIGFDDIGSFPLIVALLLSLACTRVTLAIKSAGLPNVLHGQELMKGNATAQAGSAIFQLVGGAIALVGTAVFDAGPVVLLGAIAYLVGSFFARRVTNLEHQRDARTWREDLRRMGRDVIDGLREVRRRPGASFGIFSFAWLRLQWSFVALSAALVAREVLGSESKTPLLIAAGTGAAGAVLGFVLAQALRKRVPATRLLVTALMAAAVGTLAFALLGGTAGLGTVAFVTALAYFIGKVSVDTIVQRALPDEFRGRGFALFDIALNAGWIVSAFVLWLGWESLGQDTLLLIVGVVFVLTAVVILLWSRKVAPVLDETDPEPVEPVPTTT
jgi:hypothetical protein